MSLTIIKCQTYLNWTCLVTERSARVVENEIFMLSVHEHTKQVALLEYYLRPLVLVKSACVSLSIRVLTPANLDTIVELSVSLLSPHPRTSASFLPHPSHVQGAL